MKRLIAICLSLALIMGMFLTQGIFTASAENYGWLDFNAKQFPYGQQNYIAWSAYSDFSANCAITRDAGGAGAILYSGTDGKSAMYMYKVPETVSAGSTLTITDDPTGYVVANNIPWGVHVSSTGHTAEFAITDQTGKILWPTTGGVAKIGNTATSIGKIDVTVDPGDEIYFMAMNPSLNGVAVKIRALVAINDSKTGKWAETASYRYAGTLSPNDGSDVYVQGKGGWYYMYADSVTKSEFDPNGSTDMGKDVYTATYTTKPMTNLTVASGHSGWFGAGNVVGNTTYSIGSNTYLRENETPIFRYTAQDFGTFSIGYCGVKLMDSKGWDEWTAEKGIDFAIVDKNGTVLYPQYGGPAEIRGGDDPVDRASVPSRFFNYNMEPGDYLDFVFKPTAKLPITTTGYINMSGSFEFNGVRVDEGGRLGLAPDEAQGAAVRKDGEVWYTHDVKMLYSTDLTFEKLVTDEWIEYVQLSKPFTSAPATVEAWVNIPKDVPDYKTGVILSDYEDGKEDGFTVSMDTLGRPRIQYANGTLDCTFEDIDLRTGEWTHIAFTVDTSPEVPEIAFYKNGVWVAGGMAVGATTENSTRAAVIGNDLSCSKGRAFQGALKKVAVFADVRTEAEIQSDMAAVDFSDADILGYWVLNGQYTDKSASGNTGVLTNVGSAWYKDTAPANAEDGEFTIVHIGDMQVATDFIEGLYPQMTQWLVDKKDALNIQMVVNTGDLVNNADNGKDSSTGEYKPNTSQWNDAKTGMDKLTNANIPFVFSTGNHEYPESGTKSRIPTFFNSYFPIANYFTQDGGQDAEGNDLEDAQIIYAYPNESKLTTVEALTTETLENAVYVKNINGKPYIFFALEVQPRKVVIDWANKVMPLIEAEYTDATTIVAEHHYLGAQGKIGTINGCFYTSHRTECYTPQEVFNNFISKYASISMVLCGHVASDVATDVSYGENGNKIVSIMNDPSYEGDGGEGIMLLLRYKADGTVKAEYYSPLLDAYYRPNSQFEFDFEKETVLDISTLKQMTYTDGTNQFPTSSYKVAYLARAFMQAYDKYAVAKSFTAQSSGTLKLSFNMTYANSSTTSVAYSFVDQEGNVLYPTDGSSWAYLTDFVSGSAVTHTITTTAKAGDKYYLVVKNNSQSGKASVGSSIWGTIGGTAFTTTEQTTAADYSDIYGYYYCTKSDTTLVETSPKAVVNYSAAEGGSITALTGGTWAADKLTIEKGDTAEFTTEPARGYRFAGYYVNGKLYQTGRRLTLAYLTEDMDVVARFEKVKLVGDANADGDVNVLDIVQIAKGNVTDKTVCDLYDPAYENKIDDEDFKTLRARLLK